MPSTDDPDTVKATEPDAHGRAALLIVESLIHVLIAKKALTAAEAFEVVDVASDVIVDMQNMDDDISSDLRKTLGLISAIGITLRRGDAGT